MGKKTCMKWKISEVKTEDLEKTLNGFEDEGYTILAFEPIGSDITGIFWCVSGFKKAKKHN